MTLVLALKGSPHERTSADSLASDDWAVRVGLLGPFQVYTPHRSVPLSPKAQTLLSLLALHHDQPVARDELLELLWPEGDSVLTTQSLNSLIYALRKALHAELDGAVPVLSDNSHYRLNIEAGFVVDVACFDQLVKEGDHYRSVERWQDAANRLQTAVALYRGDLTGLTDLYAIIERERLRARYLEALAFLADHAYQQVDYGRSLDYAERLLAHDPFREDGHRQAMRCYVRLGQRAQAFRQFRLCQTLLQREFGAPPEPSTLALFDQICTDPASV